MSFHNHEDFGFPGRPTPHDLYMRHVTPGAVLNIVPLTKISHHASINGHAIFAICNDPLSVHPIAAYGTTGEELRLPDDDLTDSTRLNINQRQIKPDRPLRTLEDARSLAQRWSARHLDILPGPEPKKLSSNTKGR